MSKDTDENSFGKMVIDDLDREIEDEYNQGRLERIEESLSLIESKLSNIESNMLSWGTVFWFIIGAVSLLAWGDKILDVVKFIFFSFLGFIFSAFGIR